MKSLGFIVGLWHLTLVTVLAADNAETSLAFTSPAQGDLLRDAKDGELQEHSLLRATLIAGNIVDPAQLDHLEQKFLESCHAFQATEAAQFPNWDRAVEAFYFLHREILTAGYQHDTSEPHWAIQDGRYNCVSATILYVCLCRTAKIKIKVLSRPAHVFCCIDLPERDVIIETTCPDWFATRQHLEQNAIPKLSHFIKVSVPTAVAIRELNDLQLVAKVFFNRATKCLEAGEYEQAIAMLQFSQRCDPLDLATQQNLVAGLNNWALDECRGGNFASAAKLVQRGKAIDPNYVPFETNSIYIDQQRTLALCVNGDFCAAYAILAEGFQHHPNVDLYRFGRCAIYRKWLYSLLCGDDPDSALRTLQAIRLACHHETVFSTHEVAALLAAAETLIAQGKKQTAIKIMDIAKALHPDNQILKNRCHDLTNMIL